MQKRESFHVLVRRLPNSNWQPAPRECASLTTCGNKAFLLGGLNFDANREVAELKIPQQQYFEIESLEPEWTKMELDEPLQGRCRHQAASFQDKIYTFGGCFMFNKKR
jgi:hypothetical protein